MARRTRPEVSPYKPDMTRELGQVETARLALGVARSALAERAGIPERTLRRIRISGRAWPREVRALKMALRQLRKEHLAAEALFPEGL